MMMYIDLMTCIFWRYMTYIRCDCWEILYMHVFEFWCEDVASISWINTLFACIIALIEIGCYKCVIFRILVQDVWSGSSSYARFRPRGMLVIASRGYLNEFGPKTIHFALLFLSLKLKNRNLLSLPHSLEAQLLSFPSNQSSQLGTRLCCMLEALDEHVDCKPILILPHCSSSL